MRGNVVPGGHHVFVCQPFDFPNNLTLGETAPPQRLQSPYGDAGVPEARLTPRDAGGLADPALCRGYRRAPVLDYVMGTSHALILTGTLLRGDRIPFRVAEL